MPRRLRTWRSMSVSGHGRVTRRGSTEALSGDVAVSKGSSVTFVALADAGYEIEYLKVDGTRVSIPSGATRHEYAFRNVTEDHTLRAAFKARSASPGNPGVPPVTPPTRKRIPAAGVPRD